MSMTYSYIPIDLEFGKSPFDKVLVRYKEGNLKPHSCFENGIFVDVPINESYTWSGLLEANKFNLTFLDDYMKIQKPHGNGYNYRTIVYRISASKTIYGVVRRKQDIREAINEICEILVNDLKEDAVAINFTVDKIYIHNIIRATK